MVVFVRQSNCRPVGGGYGITLSYSKMVVDRATQILHSGISWNTSSIGTAKDSGFVLSSMAKHIDKFIDEYLRVNAKACK